MATVMDCFVRKNARKSLKRSFKGFGWIEELTKLSKCGEKHILLADCVQ